MIPRDAQALLQALDDVVIRYASSGVVEWASASVETVLGFSLDDIVGTPFQLRLSVTDAASHLTDQWRPVLVMRADDTQLWMSATQRDLPDGALVLARELGDGADFVQRLNADNQTTWISAPVERLTGWTPQECLGDIRFDLIHPADATTISEEIRALRSGTVASITVQVRLRHRDGAYRWWSITGRCLGPDPATSEVLVTYRNIDAEHLNRDEVLRQERLHRSMVEAVMDPVVLVRPAFAADGRIIDLVFVESNPAAAQTLQRRDLVGRTITEVLPAEAAAELIAICGQVSVTAKPVSLGAHPLAIHGAPSTKRDLDLRVWQADDLFGITWRDIEHEAREQESMRAEHAVLRSAFDGSLDPFVLLAAIRGPQAQIVDFRYVEANEAACQFNETTREVLLTRTLREVFGDDVDEGLFVGLAQVLDSGMPMAVEGYEMPEGFRGGHRRYDIRVTKVSDDSLTLTWRDVTDRMRASERLTTSEARLALMLEMMAEGVIVHDENGLIVEANRAARAMFGMTEAQLQGGPRSTSRYRLLHADGSEMTPAEHPVTIANSTGRAVRDVVLGVQLPVGEVVWLEATAEPLPGADGQPHGVLSTFSDITEQVNSDRALRDSERRYRLLAENASEVVLRTGPDHRIDWVSPSVETVLGLSVDEVVGKRVSDLLLPGELQRLQEQFDGDLRGQGSGQAAMRFLTGDGTVRWMNALGRAICDETGAIVGGVDALRDVHEQVEAQRRLEASQTRLRQLLDSMAEGVVVVNREGAIAECNPAAEKILGVPADQLVGKVVGQENWPTIHEDGSPYPGKDHPASIALRTQRSVRGEVMGFQHADGSTAWILVNANVVRSSEPDSVTAVVTTFTDVTARMVAERHKRDVEARYRLLAENATDFVVFADLDAVLRWISPSVERVLGWSGEDFEGSQVRDFVHPDDVDLLPDQAQVSNGESVARRMRVRTARGQWRWFLASRKPLYDDERRLIGHVTAFQDVQAETQAREELNLAHQRLELVLSSSRLGVWDWNMVSGETVYNERWAQIVGYDLADLMPFTDQTFQDLTHPDDVARSDAAIAAHAQGLTDFYDIDCRMRHKDGHWVWVRDRGRIVEWDEQGRPTRMTGTHEDVTALKHATEALAASEERFRVAMRAAPMGMAVLDVDRRIVQVNPALTVLLGRPEAWLLGRPLSDVIDPADDLVDRGARNRLLQSSDPSITIENRLVRSDTARIWVQQSISLVRGSEGRVSGYVCQFTDITDARRARRQLRDLASRDPLTNLLNRREFTSQVETLNSGVTPACTLFFIDLDGLKLINDTYGHLAGDRVIAAQAKRILSVVGRASLVGRYGGDEFVVLVPDLCDVAAASGLAARIQNVTARAITVGDLELDVSCSIGIAIAAQNVDLQSTLLQADEAVYRAKREGRGRYVLYSEGDESATSSFT